VEPVSSTNPAAARPPCGSPTVWIAHHADRPPCGSPTMRIAHHADRPPCGSPTVWIAHHADRPPCGSPTMRIATVRIAHRADRPPCANARVRSCLPCVSVADPRVAVPIIVTDQIIQILGNEEKVMKTILLTFTFTVREVVATGFLCRPHASPARTLAASDPVAAIAPPLLPPALLLLSPAPIALLPTGSHRVVVQWSSLHVQWSSRHLIQMTVPLCWQAGAFGGEQKDYRRETSVGGWNQNWSRG
jgi:ribosomal protein S27AE